MTTGFQPNGFQSDAFQEHGGSLASSAAPAAGAVALTGLAPSVVVSTVVLMQPAAGGVAATGQTPVLVQSNTTLSPGVGSITTAGRSPVLGFGVLLPPRVANWRGAGVFTQSIGAPVIAWPTKVPYGAGDYALLVVETANQSIAAPSGWTQVAASPYGFGTAGAAGAVSLQVFQKFATSSSETSVTLADSGDHTGGFIVTFSGVDSTNPVNAWSQNFQSTTTAITFLSVTTTVDDCLIVHLFAGDRDANGSTMSSPTNAGLSDLKIRGDDGGSNGAGGGVAVITGEKSGSGATGNTSATYIAALNSSNIVLALTPSSRSLLLGTAGVSGQNPTTVLGVIAQPDAGSISLTGAAPVASVSGGATNITVTPDVGSVSATGQAPTLVRGTVRAIPGAASVRVIAQPGDKPGLTYYDRTTTSTVLISVDQTQFGIATKIVGTGVPLSTVYFELAKTGTPTGALLVGLYSDSGGNPGTQLESAIPTKNAGLDLTGSTVRYGFDFPGDTVLANGTTYWVGIINPAFGNSVSVGLTAAADSTAIRAYAGTWGSYGGNNFVAGAVKFQVGVNAVVDNITQPAQGVVALAGLAPTVSASISFAPGAGGITATGQTPTLLRGFVMQPAQATVTVAGVAPAVVQGAILVPGAGSITSTGLAPVALRGSILTPANGAATLTGPPPTLFLGTIGTPGAGSVTLTGAAPVVVLGTISAPGVGSITLTGLAPIALRGQVFQPSAGSITITGLTPVALRGQVFQPGAGSITDTGLTPVALRGQVFQPGAGSVTTAGLAPIALREQVFQPGAGTVTFTGLAPTLAQDIVTALGAGTVAVVGTAPALVVNTILSPGAGAVSTLGRTTASDDFNRANNANLGSAWTDVVFTTGRYVKVSSNYAALDGDGFDVGSWLNTPTFSADQYAEATVVFGVGNDAGNAFAVGARMSGTDASSFKRYGFYAYEPGSIGLCVNNAGFTSLDTQTLASPLVSGDVMRIEVEGYLPTTVRGYVNGVLQISATHNAASTELSSGQPGFNLSGYESTGHPGFDNFQAGELTGTTTQPTIILGTVAPVAAGNVDLLGYPTVLQFGYIESAAGLVTLTGQAPAVLVSSANDTPFAVSSASVTLTGYAPSLLLNVIFQPNAGSITLTGQTPVRVTGTVATPAAGSVTITGAAPVALRGQVFQPGAGSITLAGLAPALVRGTVAAPGAGSVTETGYGQTLTFTYVESAGGITITGLAPVALRGTVVTPGAGSVATAGYGETLISTYIGAAGAATITGYAPSILLGQVLQPGAGSINTLGYPATLQFGYIEGNAGVITLTGQAPAALVSSASDTPFAVSSANATITGYAPSLLTNFIVQPSAGVVTSAGYSNTLVFTFVEAAGSITIAGLAPSLLTGLVFQPGAGSATNTGYGDTLNFAYPGSAGSITTVTYAPTAAYTTLVPTRLYFHNNATDIAGTLPAGRQGTAAVLIDQLVAGGELMMNTRLGTGQITTAITTDNVLTGQSLAVKWWTSPPLSEPATIGVGSVTLNSAAYESSLNANFRGINAACVYIWRPSTGTLVGKILDWTGAALGGQEPTSALSEQVTQISGITPDGSVTAQAGDVIIVEAYVVFTQSSASGYTTRYYYNGTTVNTTPNAGVSNHASFIEFSEQIIFTDLEAPDAGAVTITGEAPSLRFSHVQPGAGSVAVSGQAPALVLGTVAQPGAGAIACTGAAPTAAVNYLLAPAAGAVTLTGLAPAVAVGSLVAPAAGAVALVGLTPSLLATMPVQAGSVALAGLAPSLVLGTVATPGAGSVTISGLAPSLVLGTVAASSAGTITVTGQAPTVVTGYVIVPASGSVTNSGQAPSTDLAVAQSAGAINLTGYAPSLLLDRIFQPNAGIITITGQAPASVTGYVFAPDSGEVSVQGQSPDLVRMGSYAPASGSVEVTGYEPSLFFEYRIPVPAGEIAIAGAEPYAGRGVPTGDVSLDGYPPSVGQSAAPDAGEVTLEGYEPSVNMSFVFAPPPAALCPCNGEGAGTAQAQLWLTPQGHYVASRRIVTGARRVRETF